MSQQWIPFTLETFTEVNKEVLFLTSSGAVVGQIRPDSANKKLCGGPVGPEAEDVTHWAPLPRGLSNLRTDIEALMSVSKAAVRLASLVNNSLPDEAAWVLALETAYQELLDAAANAADPRRKLLQDEVEFLRALVDFPRGPFDTAHRALLNCAVLLTRIAEAHEGLPEPG